MGSEQFYEMGRSDCLRRLLANPNSAGAKDPNQFNDYMNGYNSAEEIPKKDGIDDLVETIKSLLDSFKSKDGPLEKEVSGLIKSGCKDKHFIELQLDYYVGFVEFGFGKKAAKMLLDYYETIDKRGARYYRKEIFGKK